MSELQKLKKEIQSTLDQEKSNIFDGHQDEDNLRGWIEALEYCVREIELLEGNKGITYEELGQKCTDVLNSLAERDAKEGK